METYGSFWATVSICPVKFSTALHDLTGFSALKHGTGIDGPATTTLEHGLRIGYTSRAVLLNLRYYYTSVLEVLSNTK